MKISCSKVHFSKFFYILFLNFLSIWICQPNDKLRYDVVRFCTISASPAARTSQWVCNRYSQIYFSNDFSTIYFLENLIHIFQIDWRWCWSIRPGTTWWFPAQLFRRIGSKSGMELGVATARTGRQIDFWNPASRLFSLFEVFAKKN